MGKIINKAKHKCIKCNMPCAKQDIPREDYPQLADMCMHCRVFTRTMIDLAEAQYRRTGRACSISWDCRFDSLGKHNSLFEVDKKGSVNWVRL